MPHRRVITQNLIFIYKQTIKLQFQTRHSILQTPHTQTHKFILTRGVDSASTTYSLGLEKALILRSKSSIVYFFIGSQIRGGGSERAKNGVIANDYSLSRSALGSPNMQLLYHICALSFQRTFLIPAQCSPLLQYFGVSDYVRQCLLPMANLFHLNYYNLQNTEKSVLRNSQQPNPSPEMSKSD